MIRYRPAWVTWWLVLLGAVGCETALGLNANEPSLLDAGGQAGSAGTGGAGSAGASAGDGAGG